MRKFLTNKSLAKNIFMISFLIYVSCSFVNQQKTLNEYKNQKETYQSQIEKQDQYKESLIELKENADSLEYIEKIAREKLDMYMPNERVYIDKEK